jgi:hypothetical protein
LFFEVLELLVGERGLMRKGAKCVSNDADEISFGLGFRSFFSVASSAIIQFRTSCRNCVPKIGRRNSEAAICSRQAGVKPFKMRCIYEILT